MRSRAELMATWPPRSRGSTTSSSARAQSAAAPPDSWAQALALDGRLAVVVRDGRVGQLRLYQRAEDGIGSRAVFDAAPADPAWFRGKGRLRLLGVLWRSAGRRSGVCRIVALRLPCRIDALHFHAARPCLNRTSRNRPWRRSWPPSDGSSRRMSRRASPRRPPRLPPPPEPEVVAEAEAEEVLELTNPLPAPEPEPEPVVETHGDIEARAAPEPEPRAGTCCVRCAPGRRAAGQRAHRRRDRVGLRPTHPHDRDAARRAHARGRRPRDAQSLAEGLVGRAFADDRPGQGRGRSRAHRPPASTLDFLTSRLESAPMPLERTAALPKALKFVFERGQTAQSPPRSPYPMLDKTFDFKAVETDLYDRWEASGAFSPDGCWPGTPTPSPSRSSSRRRTSPARCTWATR